MKIGSLLIAAASMLSVMAVVPSSADAARYRHRHAKKAAATLSTGASALDGRADTAQEMSITNIPAADLVVGPAVTIAMPRGNVIVAVPAPATVPERVVAAAQTQATPLVSSESSKIAAKSCSANTPAAVASPVVAVAAPATTPSGENISPPASSTSVSQADLHPADIPGIDGVPSPELQKEVTTAPEQSLAMTPGEILYNNTHDASIMDPTNWSVTIYKQQHALMLYYKGRMYRKYDAVFGRNLDHAAKSYAQDRRTPEGVYTIIEKYPSRRFRWFLRLNYPNVVDRNRYETMREDGVVPIDDDGRTPKVGSAIGIHGTDVPILNSGHVNWTTGCISVDNSTIDELDRIVPVGTVVIINP